MFRINVFAAATAFCLLSASVASAETLASRGPGTIFPTVAAAAVDALHFASVEQRSSRHERGGSIVRASGGYTYSEPTRGGIERLDITLSADAVAWFVARRDVLPSRRTRADERLSLQARRMVDQVDPQGRPVFVMTPGKKILTYNDGRIAVVEMPSAPVAKMDDR